MDSEAAKLWYLKKINIFEELESEELEKLSELTHVQDIPENQPIYFPGQSADTIYLLKKGRVRISRDTPDGESITLAIIEGGEVFGEMAMAGEEERNTRAETLSNAFLCAVPQEKFVEFLEDNPSLNFEITKLIGDRRREIESKIEDLIFQDAPGRLGKVLSDLFEKHSNEESNRPTIEFSHEDLAKLSGLTRPTTTNLLNDFQEDGAIELGRKKIHLNEERKLRKKIK